MIIELINLYYFEELDEYAQEFVLSYLNKEDIEGEVFFKNGEIFNEEKR